MALISLREYAMSGSAAKLLVAGLALLLACLLAACQLPGSARQGDSPVFAENAERFQFSGWVKTVAFSQGGRFLVAGGCEAGGEGDAPCTRGLVSIWNVREPATESTYRFPKIVTAMAASPDGSKWVAGDSEGRLILSTAVSKGDFSRPIHQKAEITALAFSPDGQWVASGSLDTSFPLGLMEVKTGGVIRVKVPFEPVSAVAFSRDGKELGVGMQNGSVVVWSFTSRATPISIAAGGEKRAISSLAFSPDDRLLAYGRQDGRVVIVDRASGHVVADLRRSSSVTAVAFSPDGRYLALGQDNGKLVLVELDGAREIWSKRHIVSIADIAYSPDGLSLAVAVQQGVFLYQIGDADSKPGSLPRNERMTKATFRGLATAGPGQLRSSTVSSRKFSRVLQVSQDEFLRLLPFDRLIANSVRAMQRVVPDAVIAQNGSAVSEHMVVTAGGQSLSLDLSRLQKAGGRTGLREAVEAYESVQRVLLATKPEAADALEKAAISAILAELGPGVKLMAQSEAGPSVQGKSGAAKNVSGIGYAAETQIAEEATLEGGVRYLKMASFSRASVKQVQQWATGGAGMQGRPIAHILDLRDNAGGDVGLVVETANAFVPKAQLVGELIVRKTGERLVYRSSGSRRVVRGLVVLVNERTAGPAELLACAIRESGAGVLVGVKTAGVDDVYGVFPLPGGDALRVSTGRLYCPGERSLRWKGQSVDVEVGRAPSMSGIPVGVAQAGPMSRSRLASVLPSGFPIMADDQLRVGSEVAICLGRLQQEKSAAVFSDRRAEGSIGLPNACRMNPH